MSRKSARKSATENKSNGDNSRDTSKLFTDKEKDHDGIIHASFECSSCTKEFHIPGRALMEVRCNEFPHRKRASDKSCSDILFEAPDEAGTNLWVIMDKSISSHLGGSRPQLRYRNSEEDDSSNSVNTADDSGSSSNSSDASPQLASPLTFRFNVKVKEYYKSKIDQPIGIISEPSEEHAGSCGEEDGQGDDEGKQADKAVPHEQSPMFEVKGRRLQHGCGFVSNIYCGGCGSRFEKSYFVVMNRTAANGREINLLKLVDIKNVSFKCEAETTLRTLHCDKDSARPGFLEAEVERFRHDYDHYCRNEWIEHPSAPLPLPDLEAAVNIYSEIMGIFASEFVENYSRQRRCVFLFQGLTELEETKNLHVGAKVAAVKVVFDLFGSHKDDSKMSKNTATEMYEAVKTWMGNDTTYFTDGMVYALGNGIPDKDKDSIKKNLKSDYYEKKQDVRRKVFGLESLKDEKNLSMNLLRALKEHFSYEEVEEEKEERKIKKKEKTYEVSDIELDHIRNTLNVEDADDMTQWLWFMRKVKNDESVEEGDLPPQRYVEDTEKENEEKKEEKRNGKKKSRKKMKKQNKERKANEAKRKVFWHSIRWWDNMCLLGAFLMELGLWESPYRDITKAFQEERGNSYQLWCMSGCYRKGGEGVDDVMPQTDLHFVSQNQGFNSIAFVRAALSSVGMVSKSDTTSTQTMNKLRVVCGKGTSKLQGRLKAFDQSEEAIGNFIIDLKKFTDEEADIAYRKANLSLIGKEVFRINQEDNNMKDTKSNGCKSGDVRNMNGNNNKSNTSGSRRNSSSSTGSSSQRRSPSYQRQRGFHSSGSSDRGSDNGYGNPQPREQGRHPPPPQRSDKNNWRRKGD